ncbi:MAG: MFS transporter [Pseudomonadota bacterium]
MKTTPAAMPLPSGAAPDAIDDGYSPAYRLYVLVALCVVGFMHSVDKVVISMFMEPIKKEFLLTDTQLGLMTGLAFALMGGLVAIPLARLADRGNRKLIISASFAAWTLMTAASGMAANFMQLLAARIGVGVGEAGCVPATHSMLGDYYSSTLRARAIAAHTAGTYLGMLGGMLGGGILVQTVGWRAGFIILGVGGFILTIIFHLTVREPKRVDPPEQHLGKGILQQLGDLRVFGMLVLAFAFVGLAGATLSWMPSYLQRAFALSPLHIGLGLGLCMGFASAVGAIGGGQLCVKYFPTSRSWGTRFSAYIVWGILPFLIGSFYAPTPGLSFFCLFMTFLIAGTIAGPVLGTIQNLVQPQARATASAIVGVAAVIIGQGMGPLLVGILSDAFQVKGGGVDGLRLAMSCVALINLLTGLFFWLAARRIELLFPSAAAAVKPV